MKKKFLTTLSVSAFFCAFSQHVTIPDANFKSALVANTAINVDGDSEISVIEAQSYPGSVNVCNLAISDLTGIEAFTNINILYCFNNNLTSLDVSKNTALTFLNCSNNNLTSLNVSANTILSGLYADETNLTSLDVSKNEFLTTLSVKNNSLTSLDVSYNKALYYLNCNDNNLTGLDISTNTALVTLYCKTNSLEMLNIANGNNHNFYNMYAINNPDLSCIQVDNVSYCTTNWLNKDATADYNTSCSSSVLSTDDVVSNSTSFKLYPNPVKETLFINAESNIKRAAIYNVSGQLIKQTTSLDNGIRVSTLASGLYLVKVHTEKGVSTKRFMKN